MTLPKNSEAPPDTVAADQLISYVRRIESLEDEAKAIGDDKSEVYKEARGNGFDTKVIRRVIAKRRLGSAEREEQDALFDLYWNAIHGVVRAHVENIEEFDPATGEVLPGNGAGGTEEVASVATYGAASSDNSPQAGGVVSDVGPVPASAGQASDEDRQPIPLATTEPPPSAGANDDRGGEAPPPPTSTTVVTLQLRTHNPETHFLNSQGLERLHGCQKPELCGSGEPRKRLCFACSVQHDGPAHGEVA